MEPLPLPAHLYLSIFFFCVALILVAVFSFLETCITALRLFKLKELAKTTGRYHKLFNVIEKDPNRILITILIASSLANVTAAALITNVMESVFASMRLSQGLGFSLGIGIATCLILVFGEIIPKNFAKVHGERFFKSTLWLTNAIFYLLYPFVTFLTTLSDFVIYRIGKNKCVDGECLTSEKEIQFLIDYIDEQGLMEPEKTEMLRSIFQMGSTPVREIMVPEPDILTMNVEFTLKQALEVFTRHPFSRIPIYEGEFDNIIGMIHQRDIFQLISKGQDRPIRELVRPIMFVPENVKVNQLLREFKQQRMHMAIVLNEYGGITGLVTLENAIEEIVGEISDEHELITEKIVPLKGAAGWLVDARVDLEELEALLGITFEIEDAITLGGFLNEQFSRVPKKGEKLIYKGHIFHVQKASPKRVYQVMIVTEANALTKDIQ